MRIALGTAQFGMAYGIANATGRISPEKCAEILAIARGRGVDTVDTAIAYGDAEAVLGSVGVQDMRVITKLPVLPDDVADVDGWVNRMITGSLTRLGIEAVDSVLLHRPAQLLGRRAESLHAALAGLKSQGLAAAIGVSIYAPDELDAILARFPLDLVQAPFSVFDRRLERSGWLHRLSAAGVEVHARSVFLQGLLLTREPPVGFERWGALWSRWRHWLDSSGATPVQACLHFVLGRSDVRRVVVGVDSPEQLRQILAAAVVPSPLPPESISTVDSDLIDPSRWPGRSMGSGGATAVTQAQ